MLEKVLRRVRGPVTVADAAAKAGVPLREAEEGLRWLAAEFGGHLSATEKGELLYEFPKGLVRPPETRLLHRAWNAVTRAVTGVGRFVVRAWVSVVMVGYAVGFLALMIAMSARGNGDRDEGPSVAIGLVFRMIADALFWTFHPFSPVYVGYLQGPQMHGRLRREPKVPFYEKVNRFVFGPPPPTHDPRETERQVLAEIRRGKGRIAPADVMRVTGLPREDAERVLLRLMVDYDGEVEVSDDGAITYKFTGLRTTAQAAERLPAPAPVWGQRVPVPQLTGNTGGANALFVLVNGFNLAASGWVLANGLTIERIGLMVSQMRERYPMPLPPAEDLPLALGAIPFAFSAMVFALPIVRALGRGRKRRQVERENGWRGVLRLVLTGRSGRADLPPEEVKRAWVTAAGREPSERELEKAVRAAGGEVELGEDGKIVYRFADVQREAEATEAGRRAAGEEEARPGQVVFSSGDEGAGIREERLASDASPAALPEHGNGQKALPERQETLDEIFRRLGVDTRGRRR